MKLLLAPLNGALRFTREAERPQRGVGMRAPRAPEDWSSAKTPGLERPVAIRRYAGDFGFRTLIQRSCKGLTSRRGQPLRDDAIQPELADGLVHFATVAFGVLDVLNALSGAPQEVSQLYHGAFARISDDI